MQLRSSDTSVHTPTDSNVSPERSNYGTSGLPQISEEEDEQPGATDLHPPPAVWPEDRLRLSSSSRHTPSESVSSNGSRFGFDKRSTSSISTPPTSSASSFQLKDLLDESKTNQSFVSESSSSSPRLGTSPKTANFSRPRAPTVGSAQGPALSPSSGESLTTVESAGEWEAPRDSSAERLVSSQPITAQPASQQPTLQAVTYQRQVPSSRSHHQPFVKPPLPPLPPMPEEHSHLVAPRPVLGRSKSTTSKGQCRGCRREITGRSVKAADGGLTGRWHRECK